MTTVRVERTLNAPVADVFEIATDHANYKRFRLVSGSELLREGESEPNGTGAIRAIRAGPIRFEEEITAFERPLRMDYMIVKVNLPLEHDGGTMRFESNGEGTRVVWESRFRGRWPGIGTLLSALTAPPVRFGFNSVLKDVERLTAG